MELNELPRGWPTKPLTEIATIIRGVSFDKSQVSDEPRLNSIPILRAGNIQDSLLTNFDLVYVPAEIVNEDQRMKQGDLAICMSSGSPAIVGKTAHLTADWNGSVGAFCAIVRFKESFNHRFGSYWFRSPEFLQWRDSNAKGSNIQNLQRTELEKLSVPVPPLAEQQRIVARVDALTSRSQRLRELNTSLLEDMTRLLRAEYNRITEDAPTKPFSDVAKLVRRWVKTKPDQNYPETGIRSFGKGTFHKPALTGEQLGAKRICRIKAGDLVFMNVFAWEGAIAVAQPEDDGRVASYRFMTHGVLPDQATAEFLCYYFLTERGLEQIRGASPGSAGRNRTLGITKLEKIPVPVPRIEDQRRFAKLRKLHFQLQRLHQEAETELASFTPALLAKAFRGEL